MSNLPSQAARSPFPVMTPAELAQFWGAVQVLRTERARMEAGSGEAPPPAAGVVPAASRRHVMSVPGGDAMTVRYHRDDQVAQMKREKVRRPVAWRIHPDDAAQLAAEGQRCQTRRCLNLITIVTWRWWKSSEAARILLAEHFRCDEHGTEFAARHGIEIEARPARSSRRL